MNINDFSWSVIASIVAGLILGGGVIYKLTVKNKIKNKDTIIQVGDGNQVANKSKKVTFGSKKDD
ncbi:hypothetical protein QNH39_18780 [Neobacillus novalis]|uniref:Uncharacterized protein n=1 Tax=Neobacillus novalis TaxID=220687 RepID=A0AA95MM16_9BACI|nr:hypothetical protein [Neobacillus novalis]WHY84684.1 hypothetical protein QNH39_18780 [Neobacillus novalis]